MQSVLALLNQCLVGCKLLFDAGENCLSKFLLMIGVFKQLLFRRVRDKGGFYQNGGDALPFKHREARLFDFALVEPIDASQLIEHCSAKPQAVADGPRGSHVDKHGRHLFVDGGDVDAADQIGFVLIFREPAGGSGCGSFLTQCKNARAAYIAFDPSVGMNAYEQVCFYSASNGDTSAQTHKVVGIARHYRFHAGFRTDELHEAACNGEYDILFTSAASTDCTGILPAVTGVDNDGNDVGTFGGPSLLCRRRCRF